MLLFGVSAGHKSVTNANRGHVSRGSISRMTSGCQLTIRWLSLAFLLLLAMQQGKSSNPNIMTVVFPPLTVIQVKSLIVFCTVVDSPYTAVVIDNRTSINFQFTLSAYGTFRRLMTASYREISFSVFPLAQGFHVFAKWGIAIANTDAISVFTDDMLGTDYVISTWTDCCNATAFVLLSSLDFSSTTVTVTLPDSSTSVTISGQVYTSPFTLQLNLREVITMTSTSDLTGSKIKGSEAILVQSGSNAAAVQGTTKGQLIEALPPLSNQGTRHFGIPSTGRSSDLYRLVGSTSSNTVTIVEDGVLTVTVTLTSANPVYDYVATEPIIITSSDALLVTQFSTSDDSSGIPPAMTFIPSSDHWASYYVIKEVDGSLTRPEYVSLVIMTSYTSGVRMTYNNQTQLPVTGWTTFQSDVIYSYVTLFITETFALDHDGGQPFMVIQYGVTTNWAYSFVPVFTQTPTVATTTTTGGTSTDTSTSTSTTATTTTTTTSATTTAGTNTTTTAAATTVNSGTSTQSSSSSSSSNTTSTTSANNSSSGNETVSSSSSSWLDDTGNKVIVGVGVSASVVAVVSVIVVWRAVSTQVEVGVQTVTSALSADVTSASPAPASSRLPLSGDSVALTRVES